MDDHGYTNQRPKGKASSRVGHSLGAHLLMLLSTAVPTLSIAVPTLSIAAPKLQCSPQLLQSCKGLLNSKAPYLYWI